MENNNKNTEKINWELLAKFLAGEASEDEKSAIESWVNKGEGNKREFSRMKELFEKTGHYYPLKRFDKKSGFNSVLSKIGDNPVSYTEKQKNTSREIYLNFLKYAAVAIIFISIGSLIYWGTNRNKPNSIAQQLTFTEIELPKTIILPDSTIVTLNKETEIYYPKAFLGKTRNVEIIGEAFFEVTPNPQKPFVIKAGNTQIKVLGTSFNVNAYPASETVEVIVETGKVQVSDNENNKQIQEEVFLNPGDKATFYKKNKKLDKQKNKDPNYISWKTYNLVFKESKLSYVFDVLEKTYHVEIQAESYEIENEVLVAEFNNKPIEFILDVIRLTFNLELSVEDGRYILKSSNS